MPTQQISGTIYQMYDASGNNRRFPVTVVDGVLGLASYLHEQFSSLANLYMPIDYVSYNSTTQVLTVGGVPVDLANLSNYYTKTEADGRYLQLSGGAINAPSVNPLSLNNNTVSNTVYLTLKIQNSTKAELGYSAGYGAYIQNGVSPYHTVWLLDTGVLKFNDNTVLHSGNYSSYALPLSGGTMANTNVVTNLNADLLDGSHLSDILAMDITGNAKTATNPKSELKTGQEFMFRKTNVEWDAKSGVIKKIKGETLVANQLVEDVNVAAEVYGITRTKVSNICLHYQGTSTNSTNFTATGYFPVIAGHKYYYAAKGIPAACGINYNINIGKDAIIITADSTGTQGFGVYIPSGVYIDADVYVQAVDLTLRYGSEIDGMTDEQIIAKYESENPNPLPHNPGTLISNDAEAVETTGVNQWDDNAVTRGKFIYMGTLNDNATYCVSDYIPIVPNTPYYLKNVVGSGVQNTLCYYDTQKTALGMLSIAGGSDASGEITLPAECAYIRVNAFQEKLGNICINLSNPAINGQYFPYWKSRINLGLKNIKVVSPNVWDEEWEVIIPSGASPRIWSKNYIPVVAGQALYIKSPTGTRREYYDANYNLVQQDDNYVYNATVVVPSGVKYMKFYIAPEYGTTYNHDITINKSDPAFNGRYFPYGTLNLEGGVKGAGSAYDEISDGKKHHKRMGRVDLGGMNWVYDAISGYFWTEMPLFKSAGEAICAKYVKGGLFDNTDKTITVAGYHSSSEINIFDSAYTAADLVNGHAAWLEGVMLDYQLANEEVYDLAEPLPSVYPCDQFGTERVISPVSVTPSAPFYGDIQYGAKSDDVANDLIGTRDAVQPLLDALQYDGQNHAWHLKGNLYADGFITAYGINGGARTAVIAPYVIESSNYGTSKIWVGLNVMNEAIAKYKQGYLVQAKKAGEYITYSVTSIDESSYILYCNGGSVTVELES